LKLIQEKEKVSKQETARFLDVSDDTALRELNSLCQKGVVRRLGTGRSTRYAAK
ncbi:MAG: DeoR family transcriptional regulator, partial [Chitinivibrionales bacterium]|nr:DeoR family transcriptional regulator [Chitinivibrionales bacterium]